MKRPFLRSPVEFSRVSSGFGGRDHPLHHKWAQHKGVDFAAPGTKVFASGEGTVDFVGQQNGYGNIILRHAGGYSTTTPTCPVLPACAMASTSARAR
jgi:murein DD-endopeptidase MepM/ murein hydrolase activator NlpD